MGWQRLLRWLLMTGRREAHTRVIWTTCFSPVSGSSPGAAWRGPGPPCPGRSPALCPQTLRCVSLTSHGSKWTLLLVGPLKAQVPCHMGTSPFSSRQLCGAAVCAPGPPLQSQSRLQTRHPPSLGPQSGPQAELADVSGGSMSPAKSPSGQVAAGSHLCCHREPGCPSIPGLLNGARAVPPAVLG